MLFKNYWGSTGCCWTCLTKFDIYQGKVAPNCFKSLTNSWCHFFQKNVLSDVRSDIHLVRNSIDIIGQPVRALKIYIQTWRWSTTSWLRNTGWHVAKSTLIPCPRKYFPPSIFSKKTWVPLFVPPRLLEILPPPFFTDPHSKMQIVLPPSETLKLLFLGCQYGATMVRRNTH